MPNKVLGEINFPSSKLNGAGIEIWEEMSNFTPHFIMDVITYLCWDGLMLVMLVKGTHASMC